MTKKISKIMFYGMFLIPLVTNAQNTAPGNQAQPVRQFEWALQQSAVLGLNTNQINDIEAKNALLKDTMVLMQSRLDTVFNFDPGAFESGQLTQILTNDQYDKLLLIKNKKRAVLLANNKWAQAEQKQITGLNKDTAIQLLTAFYLNQNCIQDRYQYDQVAMAKAIQELNNNTGDDVKALNTLNPYSGADMNTQFGLALRNQQVLGITAEQRSQLIAAARVVTKSFDFSQEHPDLAIDRATFESAQMSKILTDAQYTRLLTIKNAGEALMDAKRRWALAAQKNATGNFTKENAIQQLTTYFITKQSIINRYRYDTAQTRIALNELERKTPDSLQAVLLADPYRGADMNTKFGLALKNQQALGLTTDQVFKLLAKAREVKQKSVLSKQYPDSIKWFDTPPFESYQLPSILTPQQYNQLLTLRNKDRAALQAKKDWQELTERRLTVNYNKDSTISALTAYYLTRYNTDDRYAHDPDIKNPLLRRIDARQPEALSLLKNARKGGNSKPASGSYAW